MDRTDWPEYPRYSCPECGDWRHISVVCTVWGRLRQHGPACFVKRSIPNADYRFTDEGLARCTNCHREGPLAAFITYTKVKHGPLKKISHNVE